MFRTVFRCLPLAMAQVASAPSAKVLTDSSEVVVHSLQWHVDSTISFLRQLLCEYQCLLSQCLSLIQQHDELLQLAAVSALSPDQCVEDDLVQLRAQWNDASLALDRLDLAVRSALATLRGAAETTFVTGDFLKHRFGAGQSGQFPGSELTTYASEALYSAETELDRLVAVKATYLSQWNESLAQHIRNCSSMDDNKTGE